MENTDPIKESDVAEPFDVFLWANEIDEVKNNVSAELFLFSVDLISGVRFGHHFLCIRITYYM